MEKPNKTQIKSNVVQYIASSGMTLALCVISLMLFRGLFSILQALVIPVIIVLFTTKQPQSYHLATGISLLFLTFAFFPLQFIFVLIYLLVAFVLQKLLMMMQNVSKLRYLLFILYLFFIGFLLFSGLVMTDFVFLTQLHPMMLRLSGDSLLLYAVIIMLEAAFVSGFHLLFILFLKDRFTKAFEQNAI